MNWVGFSVCASDNFICQLIDPAKKSDVGCQSFVVSCIN